MFIRTTLIAASLFTVGIASAQKRPVTSPPAKPAADKAVSLPVFTFKAARAGEVMDPSAVGECAPDRDGIAGKLKCEGSDPVVAGLKLLVAPAYYFYNGRLTSMLFLFDRDGTNYLTLRSGFESKYGAPCSTATEEWQSRGGTTVDNATATWCFKTGKLKLEAIGPSLKYGVVSYTDDFDAPTKATPVDF